MHGLSNTAAENLTILLLSKAGVEDLTIAAGKLSLGSTCTAGLSSQEPYPSTQN